jgi:hypothetical protein
MVKERSDDRVDDRVGIGFGESVLDAAIDSAIGGKSLLLPLRPVFRLLVRGFQVGADKLGLQRRVGLEHGLGEGFVAGRPASFALGFALLLLVVVALRLVVREASSLAFTQAACSFTPSGIEMPSGISGMPMVFLAFTAGFSAGLVAGVSPEGVSVFLGSSAAKSEVVSRASSRAERRMTR